MERLLAFEVLPSLRRGVESQGLARAVAEHLEQTKEHAARLESAFRALGAEPSSNRSAALPALADEREELAGKIVEPRLRDLFQAGAAVRTEHLELAVYDAALALARAIGAGDVVDALEQNRREDGAALDLLRSEAERLAGEAA